MVPTVSARRGLPVTVTDSLKRTVAERTSPTRKTPFAPCPVPERVSPVTVGAVSSVPPPSTTASPSVIAWVPRSNAAALPEASVIAPPFSRIAVAPMLRPFGSRSARPTV